MGIIIDDCWMRLNNEMYDQRPEYVKKSIQDMIIGKTES
jgi:hypothetical protein